MNNYDIIIVGSGLGGLLCGFVLSKEGFKVCILEKQSKTGGNLQNFYRHGCSFDTGVHYVGSLLPGQTLHSYWRYFGLTDKILSCRMDMDGFDRISIEDKEFHLAQGFDNFKSQLLNKFPKEEKALTHYVDQLQMVSNSFPLYNLEVPQTTSKDPYLSSGAYQFFSSLSRDPLFPAVLAGNNFLYAGNRDKTPLHIAALINHSFISSAWRLIGGSRQISEILTDQIKSMGGALFTSSEVIKIKKKGKKFQVFTSSDEHFFSTTLISNTHPGITLGMLDTELVKESFRLRMEKLQNTVSSFILNLVLKPDTFLYLNYNFYHFNTINVWTAASSKGDTWPESYLFYTPVHSTDCTFAKSAIILTYMNFDEVRKWENTTKGKRGDEYQAFKQERSERLLKLVAKKFPALPEAIVFMNTSTPLTFRDYTGTEEGSMYGIQKDFNDPLRTMIIPRTRIPNLYFTGQNVSLHGMLGVTIGAILTCGEIVGLEYLVNKIRRK